MEFRLLVALLLVFTCSELAKAKLKGDDCEGTAQFVQYTYTSWNLHEMLNFFFTCAVCIGFLNKFSKRLKEKELDPGNQDKSELELRKACREAKGKDERFVSHCKKDNCVQSVQIYFQLKSP